MGSGSTAGTMQDWPLTVDRILQNAARWHGQRAIVSRYPDGSIGRTTYGELEKAARQISSALTASGIRQGDRVATLASNSADHLALWYGIMGIGAVCHTLNPRLHEDQLAYIANHAGDVLLFADHVLAPLAARIATRAPLIKQVISINDIGVERLNCSLADFVDTAGGNCTWGGFDEGTMAGLCYTSGTTGDPKGVAYTHRSNYLHALHTISPDGFALSSLDVVMPVVPMFHANTWGLAFSAPLVGAKLVLPGPRLDGESLHELIESEGVSFSAGVPTVWQGYIEHLRRAGIKQVSLHRVVIGGAACPDALIDAFDSLGVKVIHAWGMTELSPVGLVAMPTPDVLALAPADQRAMRLKQGRPLGIDARIVDDDGQVLPHDGTSAGQLEVRGPAVVDRYEGHSKSALDEAGWFDTGDVACIDSHGYIRITDRAKDIIKSGGEWISSVDIENALLAHENVVLAAVIAIFDERWGERPKLYVQRRQDLGEPPELYREFLVGKIAPWWLPDVVEFIAELPLGATGKIDKKVLRALHRAARGNS